METTTERRENHPPTTDIMDSRQRCLALALVAKRYLFSGATVTFEDLLAVARLLGTSKALFDTLKDVWHRSRNIAVVFETIYHGNTLMHCIQGNQRHRFISLNVSYRSFEALEFHEPTEEVVALIVGGGNASDPISSPQFHFCVTSQYCEAPIVLRSHLFYYPNWLLCPDLPSKSKMSVNHHTGFLPMACIGHSVFFSEEYTFWVPTRSCPKQLYSSNNQNYMNQRSISDRILGVLPFVVGDSKKEERWFKLLVWCGPSMKDVLAVFHPLWDEHPQLRARAAEYLRALYQLTWLDDVRMLIDFNIDEELIIAALKRLFKLKTILKTFPKKISPLVSAVGDRYPRLIALLREQNARMVPLFKLHVSDLPKEMQNRFEIDDDAQLHILEDNLDGNAPKKAKLNHATSKK